LGFREEVAFLEDACSVGVGNNENSVTDARGADGCRRYAIPFRVIPARGQGSENGAHTSSKQDCHVLQQNEFRSYHANGSYDLPEESRTVAGKVGALGSVAGAGDVLAWEPCGDDVCGREVGVLDVSEDWHVWPVLLENPALELTDLAERNGSHPGSLEPEAKPADSAEEVEDIQVVVLNC
jgi:hypothetical protein